MKAVFRTGRALGTARTRVATVRRPAPTVPAAAALAAGAAGGAAGAYFLDPRNGQDRRLAVGRRVPPIKWLASLVGRGSSQEEAEEQQPVDTRAVQMAAGNGAGGPVPAKEVVGAGA